MLTMLLVAILMLYGIGVLLTYLTISSFGFLVDGVDTWQNEKVGIKVYDFIVALLWISIPIFYLMFYRRKQRRVKDIILYGTRI
jgi:hypothetical protein